MRNFTSHLAALIHDHSAGPDLADQRQQTGICRGQVRAGPGRAVMIWPPCDQFDLASGGPRDMGAADQLQRPICIAPTRKVIFPSHVSEFVI